MCVCACVRVCVCACVLVCVSHSAARVSPPQTDNVFVDANGRFLLADFGLGVRLRGDGPDNEHIEFSDVLQVAAGNGLTKDPNLVRLWRIPPTSHRPRLTLESVYDKADVYAVGCVMVSAITGHRTSGVSQTQAAVSVETSLCVCQCAVTPLFTRPLLPLQLSECVSQGVWFHAALSGVLASDPSDRLSAEDAWRAVCCGAFGPDCNSGAPPLASAAACEEWLVKQRVLKCTNKPPFGRKHPCFLKDGHPFKPVRVCVCVVTVVIVLTFLCFHLLADFRGAVAPVHHEV